jgi:hypothetical protein
MLAAWNVSGLILTNRSATVKVGVKKKHSFLGCKAGLDFATSKTKSSVVRQAIVGYWVLVNNEIRHVR